MCLSFERSGSKIKRETYLDPAPRGATDRDGEKIDIHGKLKVKIKFGDTTYQHAVYVADIADPFILGLDFLKEHGFTLDFNKNELRSIHEEVTIFKIEHRTESIRQVTANENITIPPRTEIIVPGYIGNDLTPDLLENAELSPEQKSSAERLFQEFEDVFSRNSSDIGHTTVTQHRIDTADHPPIKQHPRRLPFAKQEEVGTLLREMQENDIIEPSSSPWASPVVLVRKKDGSTRFCVDYRKLNDVTKKDSYPLPRIDDTLDTLSGHKWFSTLDLRSGYWQVEIHPEDREKNSIHFRPRTMAVQSHAVRALQCASYFRAPDGDRAKEDANLKRNPSKCKFFQKEVNYLGHIISAEGVRTDPEKVFAVKNWKRPENLRELRSFLGLCTYYRKFVKRFSNIARPLHKLTESKQKFQWTKECEDSFLQLKEALTSSPILIYPQSDKPFILDTDASSESVGAVLSQEIDGQERVVAYWSKCLSKPERNYCVTRKELLAIVKAIEHFHHYLYGQKFLLRTDHASLTWLMNFRNTEGQVARWIQRLNEYYFDIRHRKGSSHGNADALSRRPCPENCRHCSRVETKYDYAIRQITTSTATPPDPWSDEKVREDQMADPDIKPLIEFMESSSNKPRMVFYTENSNQRMERHSGGNYGNPLRKILGRALLTFEELSRILSEVEVIINHRPLTYVENDPGEPEPLTPAHFLELGYGDSKYPIHFIELINATTAKESYKKRKTYRTLLLKQLWRRWKEQYLLQLKTANHFKTPSVHKNLKLNDVVLVEGNVKSKLLWELGIIKEIFIGRDDNVRSCLVKTFKGLFKKPIQLLYPLEIV
ncbi:retrovirus-related Pol polyprotein from transposon 17.6 [Trichonephila clavipes]|nr:retrovirus-related Pol polyprotein from transposon 17.6 [Trichonephila clavipes]